MALTQTICRRGDSTETWKSTSATTGFRERYRSNEIPVWYSGRVHFIVTSMLPIAGIIACAMMVENVTLLEALTVPITFVYANFTEYIGHKGPMHHRWRYLSSIYRHTTVHHAFYTHSDFGFDGDRDFHALLLPPSILLFFFGGFAIPIGVVLFFIFSANVAYLFVATALAYFLCYELLHFCYHVREDSPLLRLPFMRKLRRHHLEHHNPSLMQHHNFNITFPIFDWVFGTTVNRDR
jgi:hypothetical protein